MTIRYTEPVFTAKDGWQFQRQGYDVVLYYNEREIGRFDGNTWMSIVASMSAVGESAEAFHISHNLFLYGRVNSPEFI